MTQKSPITTHVLDTAVGLPAAGINVQLSRLDDEDFVMLAQGVTDADGRIADLLSAGSLIEGTYRLRFELLEYFQQQGSPVFYPYAEVVCQISELNSHYHIPLLLSPFGYSTYRGS